MIEKEVDGTIQGSDEYNNEHLILENDERRGNKFFENKEKITESAKQDILGILNQSDIVVKRVKLFGKVMDDYGIDAIVSLIPAFWDAGASILSSLFLLYQGQRLWLSWKDLSKILVYQISDVLVWAIPMVGDVADYFFKANKKSAKLFDKHFEKMKQEALKQGVSQSEINQVVANTSAFSKKMDVYYDEFHRVSSPKVNRELIKKIFWSGLKK